MKNNRKGIILAGGLGTRLRPLTQIVSKQLLPIYNKPMIYYPLSILININIKEILLISDSYNLKFYKKLLGNGKQFGVNLSYKVQKRPNGIAAAYLIGEKFLNNKPSVLILGDNIFHGSNLLTKFKRAANSKFSSIFTYEVDDPSAYGVLISKNGKRQIIEKPQFSNSKKAVVGIYFLDASASKKAKKLKPSKRNELEITDLNNLYLKKKIKTTRLMNYLKYTVLVNLIVIMHQ